MIKLRFELGHQDPEPSLLTEEHKAALCTHTHIKQTEKDVSVDSFLPTKAFPSVIILSDPCNSDVLI